MRHPVFGEGEVIGYAGKRILLSFDQAGYKRLDLGPVTDGDLFRRADGGWPPKAHPNTSEIATASVRSREPDCR